MVLWDVSQYFELLQYTVLASKKNCNDATKYQYIMIVTAMIVL